MPDLLDYLDLLDFRIAFFHFFNLFGLNSPPLAARSFIVLRTGLGGLGGLGGVVFKFFVHFQHHKKVQRFNSSKFRVKSLELRAQSYEFCTFGKGVCIIHSVSHILGSYHFHHRSWSEFVAMTSPPVLWIFDVHLSPAFDGIFNV